MQCSTIIETFWHNVESVPFQTALMHKLSNKYENITYGQLGQFVLNLAHFLHKQQIKSGDKIGIISNSRYEWTVIDLSILSLTAITVPIYPTLTDIEILYLIEHSEACGLFVENKWQLDKLLSIQNKVQNLKFVIIIDTKDIDFSDQYPWPIYDLKAIINTKTDFSIEEFKKLWPKSEDLASIIYTSGTTGNPKGVMLKHLNIVFICEGLMSQTKIQTDDIILSFLPLSHIYERIGGQFLGISSKVPIAYAESMDQVAKNLIEVKPTFLNAVPRFYEKVYQIINNEVKKMPQAQRYLVRWAINIGKRAHSQSSANKSQSQLINNIYKTELRIAERLVYRKIRERLGGRLKIITSGAAPLAPEIQTFFSVIGLPIMEGYGLTETTAPVSCNFPDNFKSGTVGKPLPGIEVKFADDNELMVKGDSVFSGYYKDSEATKNAFIDGWFLTGDLANIDNEGFLKIIDRKKDIIITSGGKHIAPQYLSNLFKDEKLIKEVIAYGDFKKYITALITLNEDELIKLAKELKINYTKTEDLYNQGTIYKYIENIVNSKNSHLASFEKIKKFVLLPVELSIESGDLTPTLKVKRKVVIEKYRHLLDELYINDETEFKEKTG